MKNRVLGAAIAIAHLAFAVAAQVGNAGSRMLTRADLRKDRRPRGDTASIRRSRSTVSMDKRDARKRRNVLRARGHWRQAVR